MWESFDFAQDDFTIQHLPFNHYQIFDLLIYLLPDFVDGYAVSRICQVNFTDFNFSFIRGESFFSA